MKFVPDDYQVPDGFTRGDLRLEPLAREHNERDHRAWMSSIDHIRATPGFAGRDWPAEMSLADNERDLAEHAEDFKQRKGFTYSVLIGEDVVGCVYIYPTAAKREGEASVRSWVSEPYADRDKELYELVSEWLRAGWPFERVDYARR